MQKNYISYKELQEKPELIKNLPSIRDKITLLWKTGSYDGMLSGICMYNNEPHLLKCFIDYHLSGHSCKEHNRVFAIIKLSLSQYEILKNEHEEFREYVGWHCDFTEKDPEGKQKHMKSYPEHSLLYNLSKEQRDEKFKYFCDVILKNRKRTIDFDDNEVVGWYNNAEYDANKILITMLKYKIFDLIEDQKNNKKNRKTDNFFNSVCYYDGQKIRAHLIAYGILRNKKYDSIENYNRIPFCMWNTIWIKLFNNVTDICNSYSTKTWNQQTIIDILNRKSEVGVQNDNK